MNKINNNDLEVAHPLSGFSSTRFLVELKFGNVGFWGEGKTGEKTLSEHWLRERTKNKLNKNQSIDQERDFN